MTTRAVPSSDSAFATDPGKWDTVISASRRGVGIDLREAWRYRDLLLLFVRRDFVALHKQTVLGPVWFLIQPLFAAATFWFAFGKVANLSTDGLPPILFYMTGVMCWTYFASCIVGGSAILRDNASLFGKVYFPRLIVPFALSVSHALRLGVQLVFLLLFVGYYAIAQAAVQPSAWILALPLFIALIAALGLGIGLIVAAFTTKYRDLALVVPPGVQLLMFVSPVAYPLSALSGMARRMMSLNPMTPIIEGFRKGLHGQGSMDPTSLAYAVAVSFAVLLVGMVAYSRAERTFVDTI